MTKTPKPANRHHCMRNSSVMCTKGTGKGPKKCKYCGSTIVVDAGHWGVFVWSEANRYDRDSAVKLYRSKTHAEGLASKLDLVVRWIPAD